MPDIPAPPLPHMDTQALIDAFVATVNAVPRRKEFLEDVPAEVRCDADGETDDKLTTCWRIIPFDHATRIDALESRMGRRFPPSFRSLLCRYSYPAFEFGPVMFFANTGHDLFWEYERNLLRDKTMSPVLLDEGYIQIGNPWFYNYDPVCIYSESDTGEGPVVQFEHEAILTGGRLSTVRQIAPSFTDLITSLISRPKEIFTNAKFDPEDNG